MIGRSKKFVKNILLKGKRFDTVEEITSIGIDEIFIYDYELVICLSREYITKTKPFLPTACR